MVTKINKVREKIKFVHLKHEFSQKLINGNIKKLKNELKERRIVLEDIEGKLKGQST